MKVKSGLWQKRNTGISIAISSYCSTVGPGETHRYRYAQLYLVLVVEVIWRLWLSVTRIAIFSRYLSMDDLLGARSEAFPRLLLTWISAPGLIVLCLYKSVALYHVLLLLDVMQLGESRQWTLPSEMKVKCIPVYLCKERRLVQHSLWLVECAGVSSIHMAMRLWF